MRVIIVIFSIYMFGFALLLSTSAVEYPLVALVLLFVPKQG